MQTTHKHLLGKLGLGLLPLLMVGIILMMGAGNSAEAQTNPTWAFEETFDGDPSAPSQDLLPRNFDYAVTHRTHPKEHFTKNFSLFPADHASSCAGPDPSVSPLPQHNIRTSHLTNGTNPDESFYICKNHLMTAMGEVEGYSVTSFWPKQEFDFSQGGVLEFDVNLNNPHPRSWFEVMITTREELKVGAAQDFLPIDETYPSERIVFQLSPFAKRTIMVGENGISPNGWLVNSAEPGTWLSNYPSDPANNDRRIRRTMRITFNDPELIWEIEKQDGTFDTFKATVPGGFPIDKGLVVFKTHAYTPTKDGNRDEFTFHWDNIRFTGPVVGRYETYDAQDVVYLQDNGNKPIGSTETVTINFPEVGANPRLFGQIHNPMTGQVLLSVNGRPDMVVHPVDYGNGTCRAPGWKSFSIPLDPSWLKPGANTFKWTVGPRPSCVDSWIWNGFSVKNLQVQFDLDPNAAPTATNTPMPQPTATNTPVGPQPTATNTPVGPQPTATNTPVGPQPTATNTPVGPTPTSTPIGSNPTATPTASPTATATLPPNVTPTATATPARPIPFGLFLPAILR